MSIEQRGLSGLIQIPQVILTPKAFDDAREAGIVGIDPNIDHMLAIGQITKTGADYVPDMTVLRSHNTSWNSSNWDTNYKNAPGDFTYHPAYELAATERPTFTVSAENVRDHINSAGKKILELTVKDWGQLGILYAEAIENSKSQSHPNRAADSASTALATATNFLLRRQVAQSPRDIRIDQARNLQPYDIRRR